MSNDMFEKYPDVVSIKQLCEMLGGIGPKTAYQLLHEGEIRFLKIGRGFRIPKKGVIEYVERSNAS